jgi:hypothetical protein
MRTSKYNVDNPEDRTISVLSGGTWAHFTLETTSPKKSTQAGRTPAARLRLVLGSVHHRSTPEVSWEDSNEKKLERSLAEIAVAVVVKAEQRYRSGCIYGRNRLIEQKAEVEKQLIEEQRERERKEREAIERERRRRVDELLQLASDFKMAETIRSCVATMRNAPQEVGIRAQPLDVWVSWALGEADRIDPIRNGRFLVAITTYCHADSGPSE